MAPCHSRARVSSAWYVLFTFLRRICTCETEVRRRKSRVLVEQVRNRKRRKGKRPRPSNGREGMGKSGARCHIPLPVGYNRYLVPHGGPEQPEQRGRQTRQDSIHSSRKLSSSGVRGTFCGRGGVDRWDSVVSQDIQGPRTVYFALVSHPIIANFAGCPILHLTCRMNIQVLHLIRTSIPLARYVVYKQTWEPTCTRIGRPEVR